MAQVPNLLAEDLIQLQGPKAGQQSQAYLVYFVCGNPGLIKYYRSFLAELFDRLNSTVGGDYDYFHIYGRSLGGFEVLKECFPEPSKLPLDLGEQIDFMEEHLMETVAKMKTRESKPPRVILIGHSVGAYMSLEITRRHRERLENGDSQDPREPMIEGTVCLFPTVTHIAKSNSGQKLTMLSKIPYLPQLVSFITRGLVTILPSWALGLIIQSVMGFPEEAAQTTLNFLKSPSGILQSLHMGRDEMERIGADAWDAEIWGAAHPSPTGVPRPKLFFYFGKNDHWVADHTRDDLIRLRGRQVDEEQWKPHMEIDDDNIPHGFSIYHSSPIVRKVVEFIQEIVQES